MGRARADDGADPQGEQTLSGGALAPVPAKMSTPPERREHIRRPELERKLREARGARFLLVSAPAGYGKTTMLARWARTSGRPVAWVSLDPGDRSARRFWSYVLAAIGRILPEEVREAANAFESSASLEDVVLPRLLADLATAPEGLLLILDDFHEASSASVDTSLSAAVEGVPEGLQIIASTRHDPVLPISRWRVRGWLAEIRQADLRMTEEEAGAWFRDRMGLQTSAETTTQLMELTEGWPAGLYLASLFLRDSPDLEAATRRLVEEPRLLREYAIDEILTAWPASIRSLMRRVSVLERFSEPLLEEVIEPAPTREDVRDLERRNLLVTSLDGDHAWYRIHPLLSEVLRLELRATEPAAGPEILRRASRWHIGRGETELAISYAIRSGD